MSFPERGTNQGSMPQKPVAATKEESLRAMKDLVGECAQVIQTGKEAMFAEADVGSKFILPLLEILGWNTRNIDEVQEQRRTLTGPVDYALKLFKRPKLVVEMKRLSESLDGYRIIRGNKETFPEQAIRYAWHLKLDWVVLTNFKETRLYYSQVKNPADGLVLKLGFNEYSEDAKFKQLWAISKESVGSGVLETYEKRRARSYIDKEVLDDLLYCRKILTENIRRNHPDMQVEEIREAVQRILDRILIIRVAEDRNIIGADSIWREQEAWRTRDLPTPFIRSLKSLFRDFDEVYNSKLFEPHRCEDLHIDNKVIGDVIDRLYRYNFDLISADVLGAIYEDYIGHVLEARGRGVEIIDSFETRREGGIYYTPSSIVEYIVRNTVSRKLAACKSPENITRLRVLDPAVGSGSFLIKASDAIKEWYNDYSVAASAKFDKGNMYTSSGGAVLFSDVGARILTNNLFGVDQDPQAAEIATVNLLLGALEKGTRLPFITGQNIRVANSLVSCSKEELKDYFKEPWPKPIVWEVDFEKVFSNGGFDVVIGNPPWGADLSAIRSYLEKKYELAVGQYDSFELFLELSKRVLKDGGVWGFVVPDSIFKPEHKRLREFLCKNFRIDAIVKLGEGFFEDVFRASVIIIFSKTTHAANHQVKCMTLMKSDRDRLKTMGDMDILALEKEKGILVPQSGFEQDPEFSFEIASTDVDKSLMEKMEDRAIDWHRLFDTWRGVEFSEQGEVVRCPNCFKWNTPPRKRKGVYIPKICANCGHTFTYEQSLAKATIVSDSKKDSFDQPFLPGEAVNRYYASEKRYLDTSKDGINYKDSSIYQGKKLLIRKTGVGIYSTIDKSGAYVPQAVFIFKLRPDLAGNDAKYNLEYILGVLNSRLLLYYYYKKFGELEWKSFPYVTQKTIQQLPVHAIDFQNREEADIHGFISRKVFEVIDNEAPIGKEEDFEIEDAVMRLYGITPEEKMRVWEELGKVQKLRIIRETMGSDEEEDSKSP